MKRRWGNKRLDPKGRRKVLATAVGLVAIYVVLSFFLGEKGLIRYVKLRYQKAEMNAEIAGLRDENEGMREQVEALKTDRLYIERLAREQGLVKEGEIVYQYEGE